MITFEQAQLNHDNAGPPDEHWNEPNDDHEAQAIAELGDDPGALWGVLEASSWYKDHVSYLFDHSPDFRAEVLRVKDDWIKVRAQELADLEAKDRADEAAIDRGGYEY